MLGEVLPFQPDFLLTLLFPHYKQMLAGQGCMGNCLGAFMHSDFHRCVR